MLHPAKPTAIVSPYGQRTALTLDANGYLATAADPAGSVHAYTYSADGLMASYLDPNAGLHTFSYDAYGLLLRDANPAGGGEYHPCRGGARPHYYHE